MKARRTVANLALLMTVYRRGNLTRQLNAIINQKVLPARLIIYQNENHSEIPVVKIPGVQVEYVFNSGNTKFFGRFAYLLNTTEEYVAVMDDDIIPGKNFVGSYLKQTMDLKGIVGANGRAGYLNTVLQGHKGPPDVGFRPEPVRVDFVGHAWFFHRSHLYEMFSVPPLTLDTGEDMHLCFSAYVKSGTPSYVAAQRKRSEYADTTRNSLADDSFSSYKKVAAERRQEVELYFVGLGYTHIGSR